MPELPMIAPAAPSPTPNGIVRPQVTEGADISRDADQMTWLLHQAKRDEEVGQVSDAIGQYALKEADIRQKLSTVTDGDQYINDYKAATSAARDQVLSQFGPGAMRNRLAGELNLHLADDIARHAVPTGVALKVKSAHDSITGALATNAMAAVNAADKNDRDYFLNQGVGLIRGFNYWTEGEKQQREAAFRGKVDLLQLQSDITRDPKSGMVALMSPDFAKAHPMVTPEQKSALIAHADSALRLPQQMLDAEHAAASAQVMNGLLARKGAGTLDAGEVQKQYDAGMISAEEFKRLLPGQRPMEPSEPGVMKNLKDAIDDNPMSMSAYDIMTSTGLAPHDAAALRTYLTQKQQESKREISATALAMRHRLINELFPPSMAILNSKLREAQVSQLRDDWESEVKNAKSVQDLYRSADELRRIYGPDAKFNKGKIPPRTPGETDEHYGARLRAMGVLK